MCRPKACKAYFGIKISSYFRISQIPLRHVKICQVLKKRLRLFPHHSINRKNKGGEGASLFHTQLGIFFLFLLFLKFQIFKGSFREVSGLVRVSDANVDNAVGAGVP